jgi:hypothetical protein
MGGHHLIMGKSTDFITGDMVDDTHDERLRQSVARILVESLGYDKSEIQSRLDLTVQADARAAVIRLDFAVRIRDRFCMIVKYGPGSLITRHRPALAASRLLAGYQIPVVVATNGRDADILDGETGKLLKSGLEAIPSRKYMEENFDRFGFLPTTPERREKESRLLYAYEVDDACPCDDTICRLPPG